MKSTHFERAIFLSWYCSKGDCTFCYMSIQKSKIKNPRLARRSLASIIAEALICKACGWEIEFLSGGYESHTLKELVNITKIIKQINQKKLWLNIGVLNKKELQAFKPYIQGVTGAIEVINPHLHKKICPSKPIKPIEKMFKSCDKLKLKKSMTLIIGLGETLEDFPSLKNFIKKYKINRITFYALNPHQGTPFKKGPKTEYYIQWIKKTRKTFPKLQIIAGSWVNRLDEIHHLLNAGADHLTKFPSIKLFNTKHAKKFEAQVKKANRKFTSTLTKLPKIDWQKQINSLSIEKDLKEQVKITLNNYLKKMQK
ncbi:radical SAM protein [Candidatus Woesearchaeota archaeon]|nr:radical SAM protein [Candidatus Woesearchaeota archaeon]